MCFFIKNHIATFKILSFIQQKVSLYDNNQAENFQIATGNWKLVRIYGNSNQFEQLGSLF